MNHFQFSTEVFEDRMSPSIRDLGIHGKSIKKYNNEIENCNKFPIRHIVIPKLHIPLIENQGLKLDLELSKL